MNYGTFHRMRGANNSPHVCLCARTCNDMYDRAAVRDDGVRFWGCLCTGGCNFSFKYPGLTQITAEALMAL